MKRKELINNVKKRVEDVTSLVHGFEHMERTATGAQWFTKVFGGTAEEQEISYIAGLIHDLHRPDTEKTDHMEASVNEAREFLHEIGFDESYSDRVLDLIEVHRRPTENDFFTQSVYFADKILEQMGAYVVFRRCIWIDECTDFRGMPFKEAFVLHTKQRANNFSPDIFPEPLRRLVSYQFSWHWDFMEYIEEDNKEALELALYAYSNHKKFASIEELARSYITENELSGRYRKEALGYMSGRKLNEWAKLID